jgi:N6-L-threonylcarbamoyladenine synthase
MKILGIESSCDETSAAVVDDRRIESLVIASQTDAHAKHRGVVPEIASRAHTENIRPVVDQALEEAGVPLDRIDGIAVTHKPGLSGSLAVGLVFAKALSYASGIPYVAVDHIYAHAYAVQLERGVPYPYLVLLVSGGHTLLAVSRDPATIDVLGTTIDDACGEAFDKVAAFLGLPYPGGPEIDRLAARGDARAYSFPQPRLKGDRATYSFSYSGLKTAVVHQLDRFLQPGYSHVRENIAAAFQDAAVAQLTGRIESALDEYDVSAITAGGGVASNSLVRERIAAIARGREIECALPSPRLCVDNGAMVAGLGAVLLQRGVRSAYDAGVSARVSAFRDRT